MLRKECLINLAINEETSNILQRGVSNPSGQTSLISVLMRSTAEEEVSKSPLILCVAFWGLYAEFKDWKFLFETQIRPVQKNETGSV